LTGLSGALGPAGDSFDVPSNLFTVLPDTASIGGGVK
jgi:hypothetical protein